MVKQSRGFVIFKVANICLLKKLCARWVPLLLKTWSDAAKPSVFRRSSPRTSKTGCGPGASALPPTTANCSGAKKPAGQFLGRGKLQSKCYPISCMVRVLSGPAKFGPGSTSILEQTPLTGRPKKLGPFSPGRT